MTPREKAEEIVIKWASTEPKGAPTKTIVELIPFIAEVIEEKDQEIRRLKEERDEYREKLLLAGIDIGYYRTPEGIEYLAKLKRGQSKSTAE